MRTNQLLKDHPPDSHSWTGKVTFSFSYPNNGWIQFAVTCTTFAQGVIVHFSNVFDPFPEFIQWLGNIADGKLPSEFVVDEEGDEKIFRASPVNENDFIFEILDWLPDGDNVEEQPIFLYTQVSRKQFLSEFLKRWEDFLGNQYDPAHWEDQVVPSLRDLEVSKIREFLRG